MNILMNILITFQYLEHLTELNPTLEIQHAENKGK